jgi:energy-converting hydrogenase Eha subunit B
MSAVNRLGLIITVMLALTALYYLSTIMSKPSQPQVVVVRPSGAQNVTQPGGPVPAGGFFACTKAVYLKVGAVSLCADVVYSVLKTDDSLQVDFQGGVVQGFFTFISAPSCAVTTTPQGILIPCRAQILIPANQ